MKLAPGIESECSAFVLLLWVDPRKWTCHGQNMITRLGSHHVGYWHVNCQHSASFCVNRCTVVEQRRLCSKCPDHPRLLFPVMRLVVNHILANCDDGSVYSTAYVLVYIVATQ